MTRSASASCRGARGRAARQPRARGWLTPWRRWRSERQAEVLRAFSMYFQLANLAEQHHRLRRRREYEHEQRVPRESLAEAFSRLERADVSARQLAAAARRLSLELVLTAHPTEATRRTVLAAQLRLDRLLDRLDDPALHRSGREAALDRDRRGGDRPVADRRGALAPSARRRRDPPRALVLRDEPARRRARARRRPPRAAAGGGRAAPLRKLDRRRPGRQPCGGAADDRGGGSSGPRSRPRSVPNRGARAGGVPRRRRHTGRGLARAPPLDRQGRARDAGRTPRGSSGRTRTSRTGASSRSSGIGSARRWQGAKTATAHLPSSSPISSSSIAACARTGARASPTGGSRHCAGASSCSGSTSRSSTCACMHGSWPGRRLAPGRRSPPRRTSRSATARKRSTRSWSRGRPRPRTSTRRSHSRGTRAHGSRWFRCSRRSTTFARPRGWSRSCSPTGASHAWSNGAAAASR